MPELPEVESLRIGLSKNILGQKILNIQINNYKIVFSNSNYRKEDKSKALEFESGLKNKIIIKIERRAKNLIIFLDDDSVILIHLKMTGQIIFAPKVNENKHTHIIFTLTNGILHYNDVRKFGYVLYFKNISDAKLIFEKDNLGLEPFDKDFTLKYFAESIIKKNKSIKTVLLEQSVAVGCGNIYTDEICFASKVLPMRVCKTLNEKEIVSLYDNIKRILKDAIKSGGSSISDYKLINGESGKYGSKHKVYGKAGTPCSICKNQLQKTIISGRSTVHCDVCQK